MTPSAPPVQAGRRIAVVLFNLGGPDTQEAVRPFLFNLFNDPAIIGLPGLFRTPLAGLISSRREKTAQANYALMGGGSPLLPETRRQAEALKAVLDTRRPDDEVRVFIAMRYWAPLTEETAADVAAFQPDEIVLLPLYPQFSTTTTESSAKRWAELYTGSGVARTVCCWPQADGWIEAQATAISLALHKAGDASVRILFSAHGIPERLVEAKGDPYREQVQSTVDAVMARVARDHPSVDHGVCFQSRVGPMKWLGPSTPEAITQAAEDGVGVVIVPVAFVSEHVETLVELDIEYAELAHGLGVSPYLRTPTVGVTPAFVAGLADVVETALERIGVAPHGPGCRADWKACPRTCEGRAA